jgi:A/G-specific adenine glycosylase
LRVITRLFEIEEPVQSTQGKRIVKELAKSLLPKGRSGAFNQALMDLGSLLCVPRQPKCDDCPLTDICMARASRRTDELPVRLKKRKARKRYFTYLHIRQDGYTYIQQRTGNDIWRNLYEFPLIETNKPIELEALLQNDEYNQLLGETASPAHSPAHPCQLLPGNPGKRSRSRATESVRANRRRGDEAIPHFKADA